MSMLSLPVRHCLAAIAALVASGTLLKAALPAREEAPKAGSLVGQLLVASPRMGDPRFRRTVILMVRHDKNGALGVTINRPLEERPLASLLEALGEKDVTAEGSVRIFAGGPVQPQVGFVIHTAEYRRPETITVDGQVAVTSSREVLRDMARGQGPRKALVAFGYAGWSPGQLEGELLRSDWFTATQDPRLIFDLSRDRVWDDAMQRRTREL
jgi:putative transcriptional regulator